MICRSWYRCFIVCGGTLCVFVYGTLCDVCVFVCDTPLCACAMCICAMCIWAGQPSVKAGIQCEYQPNLALSCSMITLIISIIAVIVNDTANSTNDDKKPQNASVQTIATANQLLSINVRTICLPSDEDLSVDGSMRCPTLSVVLLILQFASTQSLAGSSLCCSLFRMFHCFLLIFWYAKHCKLWELQTISFDTP